MRGGKGSSIILWAIVLYLLIPLFMTLVYSLFTEWMDVLPKGFTLKYYAVIFRDAAFWQALARTVVISIVPVIAAAAMILLAMYVVVV